MNRDEFKKYILRSLGAGAIEIEITQDQLDDRISDAITKFQRFHPNGSGTSILVIPKDNPRQTKYTLPKNVLSVARVMHGRYSFYNLGVGVGATDEYLLYGRRPSYMNTESRDGQVITPYFLQEQFYNTFLDVVTPDQSFNFSPVTRVLELHSPIDRRNYYNETVGGLQSLYLECTVEYDERTYPDIYDHEWIRDYSTALVGRQWGRNLMKFQNIALPGQGVLNGAAIFEEYDTIVKNMEAELKSSSIPYIFVF